MTLGVAAVVFLTGAIAAGGTAVTVTTTVLLTTNGEGVSVTGGVLSAAAGAPVTDGVFPLVHELTSLQNLIAASPQDAQPFGM